MTALSETVFVKGPIWSNEDAKATRPKRETLPYVGFKPTTPQWDAGWRMDPPVSEPKAPTHMSAAIAAADPPLEPPGIRVRSHGLRVNLKPECSLDDPMANSSMFSLPRITAPAFFNFWTTVAS